MEVTKGSARDISAEPLIALCSILLARFARRYASNHQLTTHHEDRLAANPYIGDPLRSAANGNMNPARPTHGHSLHVDDALRGIFTHETVTHEISAERTAYAPVAGSSRTVQAGSQAVRRRAGARSHMSFGAAACGVQGAAKATRGVCRGVAGIKSYTVSPCG